MSTIKLTRKELFEIVWSTPLLTLSKKYRVSDTWLRKICIKHNIPLPKKGYWQRIRNGYKVTIPVLLSDPNVPNEISIHIKDDENCYKKSLSSLKSFKDEILSYSWLPLNVQKRLSKPDALVVSAEKILHSKESRQEYGLYSSKRNGLDIRVSKSNIIRALRIMDAIIKLLKARKHDVVILHNGWKTKTMVVIGDEKIEICIRERLKRSNHKTEWGRVDYIATGILCFRQGDYYHFKETSDGKGTLESKLVDIIAKLEMEAYIKTEERKMWRERQRIREEQERIAIEIKKRKEDELKNFIDLFNMANRFHQANYIRNYLRKMEHHSKKAGEISDKLKLWLDWANEKVDWFDPFINKEDPLLDGFDKIKISRGFLSNQEL